MRPAARVQTAIELLDQVIEAAKTGGPPADRIVAQGFRDRRYAGSKDKRAIRELVFSAIRACGPIPANGRAAMLRLAEDQSELTELFDGSDYGPAKIRSDEIVAEGGVGSDWLVRKLAQSGLTETDMAGLLERAPLDLRVNTLKSSREELHLPETGETLAAPNAVRFSHGTKVEQWPEYQDGQVEIQDHGSQIACIAADVQPGQTVIDLCAGAGGKTLALAAAMRNQGNLIACDTNKRRLAQLAPRAERAGASISDTILLDPGKELEALTAWRGKADCVFVDAPCSGSGTWRRKPETRWRLSEDNLNQFVELQRYIIDYAAELVRSGGAIMFVTCSLFDEEGSAQIEHFLQNNPQFLARSLALPVGEAHGVGTRLLPSRDKTDGFFIARLEKL